MAENAREERDEPENVASHEGDGHSTSPQVQTPDKPSQAEGDRDTIDVSIREKESPGAGNNEAW